MIIENNNWYPLISIHGILYLLLMVQVYLSAIFQQIDYDDILIAMIFLSALYTLSHWAGRQSSHQDMIRYFWTIFAFGNVGVFASRQVNLCSLYHMLGCLIQFNSFYLIVIQLFFNWMSLIIVMFCWPVCIFFCHISLSHRFKRYLFYLISILFLLVGIAAGHAIASMFSVSQIVADYFIVSGAALSTTICYALLDRQVPPYLSPLEFLARRR